MDIKTAAQTIRDTVSMDEVLSLYGYQANRSGFMCCPFHGEREPSMKIYKGKAGWHCFGCGRGGSVVDFVMEHEGSRQRKLQLSLDGFVSAVYSVCDAMITSIEHEKDVSWRRMKKCIDDPQNATTEDWNFYFTWEEEDQYNDYRIEKIQEFKKEVAAWRRTHRKSL